jgi:hypothetical protein
MRGRQPGRSKLLRNLLSRVQRLVNDLIRLYDV